MVSMAELMRSVDAAVCRNSEVRLLKADLIAPTSSGSLTTLSPNWRSLYSLEDQVDGGVVVAFFRSDVAWRRFVGDRRQSLMTERPHFAE
jgi:hypothetical protein